MLFILRLPARCAPSFYSSSIQSFFASLHAVFLLFYLLFVPSHLSLSLSLCLFVGQAAGKYYVSIKRKC